MNPIFGEQIVFNLVDGVIRIAIFLLFIWGVSLLRDIRRVYEYHGAEHKTVYAFENGDSLETAAVQKYSTYHPRCGTSFLMTVMLISILVYTVVPVTPSDDQAQCAIVALNEAMSLEKQRGGELVIA